jgi:uncharacterized RDD family membrane protein YckC
VRSSLSSSELDAAAGSNDSAQALSQQWKQEANRRLAAHRARRGGGALQAALPGMEEDAATPSGSRGKSVADRVAARYAKAPTYSEMLAAEARNAVRAAEAASVAAGEARDAAQAILEGLDVDLNDGLETCSDEPRPASQSSRESFPAAHYSHFTPVRNEPVAAMRSAVPPAILEVADDESEHPIQPLPAKLLEFPRELIAARKARPRLAEGPLREVAVRDCLSQLRIFEVEAETISTDPALDPVLPGWSAIRLDSVPEPHSSSVPADQAVSGIGRKLNERLTHGSQLDTPLAGLDLPMQTASLEDRVMAAVVDLALVTAGFLLFVFVFVACTVHPPTGKPAAVGAAVVFFGLALIYQVLFFKFGSDTPGMRYAKIALCTFDDENPTRQTMLRRIGALLLSASPLGLGVLWAFFDDDRLGWHDRISKTYQRSYR